MYQNINKNFLVTSLINIFFLISYFLGTAIFLSQLSWFFVYVRKTSPHRKDESTQGDFAIAVDWFAPSELLI